MHHKRQEIQKKTVTVNEYWEKFADQLNVKFPGNYRKDKSKTII